MNDETPFPVTACLYAFFVFLVLFIFAVPVRSESGCLENNDCSAGSYCKKVDGDCEGVGICEGKAEVCIALVEPVCGCDGVTYPNSCEAAVKGISLMYNDECQGHTEASVRGVVYDKREPWCDTLYVNLENCNGLLQAVEDLEHELVTVQVGTFFVVIPGTHFVLTKTGNFVYYHPGKMAGEETTKLFVLPVSERAYFYCGNTKLNGNINPIAVELTIGEWFCRVTREWEELPSSVGVKYRAK